MPVLSTLEQPENPSTATNIRPLLPADLNRVVEIDREITGTSRRGFYEKRLAAMRRHPQDFIALGYAPPDADPDGFVLAHLLDGEFGGRFPVAMLDAIGVVPARQGRGIGKALLQALETVLRVRGAREIRSEAAWTDRGLLRLFASSSFALAPRIMLERSTSDSNSF